MDKIPRMEHPRPQMQRADWQNLNGEWDFAFDFGRSGVYQSIGCDYTRTTGIWQTVWLEFVPRTYYTAPEDAALEKDIRLSLAAGFNGARLHQKVFEERFLYHCDRLGYLVWGEQGSWGLDYSRPDGLKCFLPEWMEVLERDFNHPAIIGWCPFNETWDYEGRKQDDELLRIVYLMTRQYDTTRPCIDTSGHFHVMTDIFDVHDYEQDPVRKAPGNDLF